jgi:Hydantoinase/oxoprolinase N-terminal region/Hydantoinase/oxoprolinase
MRSSVGANDVQLAIAVGDTSTHAVAVDAHERLLAQAEVDTAVDPGAAFAAAIREVVADSAVDPARVTRVTVGTGRILDKALDSRAVDRVLVIRIGGPLTHAIPPLAAWPPPLRAAVSAGEIVVGGGVEFDGRVTAALDEAQIVRRLATLDGSVDGVAITGVFSPVAPDQELAAAAVIRRELGPDIRITLSHELGALGLMERENAAVLNAALAGTAERVAATLEDALRSERIGAEPFLAQSDGGLMALQSAESLPVLMLDSGPASAMRGAVHLTGVGDAVVVHVDGSTAEVGTVVHGVPRRTASLTEVAGVRIGVRMPGVRRLRLDADWAALAEAVSHAGAGLRDPPVLLVGRPGDLVPEALRGIGRVLCPAAGEAAAAVGATTAEVTGRAYRISPDRPDRREEALQAATDAALALAVHAGADPKALHVVAVDEAPLTYDIEPAVQISVSVAGPPL